MLRASGSHDGAHSDDERHGSFDSSSPTAASDAHTQPSSSGAGGAGAGAGAGAGSDSTPAGLRGGRAGKLQAANQKLASARSKSSDSGGGALALLSAAATPSPSGRKTKAATRVASDPKLTGGFLPPEDETCVRC